VADVLYTMADVTNEPTRIGVRDARMQFPSLVDEAAEGARFVVTLYGNDRCAIVPMGDLAKILEVDARKPAKRRSK